MSFKKHYYNIEVTYGSAFQENFCSRIIDTFLKVLKEHMETSHRHNIFKWSKTDEI